MMFRALGKHLLNVHRFRHAIRNDNLPAPDRAVQSASM
jgi:hypothetical protein